MSRFSTTRWSLIDLVALGDSPAITEFVRIYRPILWRFLVTVLRQSDHDADDLLQDFLTHKLLQGGLAGDADRQRGSFRSFLKTALQNFVRDRLRRDCAQKRAPDHALEWDDNSALESESPEHDAFDTDWARTLMREALTRMKAECEHERQSHIWIICCERILLPALTQIEEADYGELTRRCGLESIRETQNALVTGKRKLMRHVRAVVGNYVLDPDQIDEEVQELQRVLSNSLHACDPAFFADLFTNQFVRTTREGMKPMPESLLSGLFSLEDTPPCNEFVALEELLSSPLDRLLPDSVPPTWQRKSFRDLFQDSSPPLELLQSTKQLGRRYSESESEELCNAGAVLYFLAIAAALVRHDRRITSSNDIVLHQGLLMLCQQPWCDEFQSALIRECLNRLRLNSPEC